MATQEAEGSVQHVHCDPGREESEHDIHLLQPPQAGKGNKVAWEKGQPKDVLYFPMSDSYRKGELATILTGRSLSNTFLLPPEANQKRSALSFKKKLTIGEDCFVCQQKSRAPPGKKKGDAVEVWELLVGPGTHWLKTLPANPSQPIMGGTMTIASHEYTVARLIKGMAILQRQHGGFYFFGEIKVKRVSIDECNVTVKSASTSRDATGFKFFRVRKNCIALCRGVSKEKTKVVTKAGIYVLPLENVASLLVYDFNKDNAGHQNYGDAIVRACRLRDEEWIWYYSDACIAARKMWAEELKGVVTVDGHDSARPAIARAEKKGINVIIYGEDNCRFHSIESNVPQPYRKSRQTYRAAKDAQNGDFFFEFHDQDHDLSLVRLCVPDNKILYYVEQHDACHLLRVNTTAANLTDRKSVLKYAPNFAGTAAFVRCTDYLVFYHRDRGCIVCERISDSGDHVALTGPELRDFDREFKPSFQSKELLGREVERVTEVLKNCYYRVAIAKRLSGDSRSRELLWSDKFVRLRFHDILCDSFQDTRFGHFLILELDPNVVAIVGPDREATYTQTVDAKKRTDGYLQYRDGRFAVDLTTTKLYGLWSTRSIPLCGQTIQEPFKFTSTSADGWRLVIEVQGSYYMSDAIAAIVPNMGTIRTADASEVRAENWFLANISGRIRPIVKQAFSTFIKLHDIADVFWELAPDHAKSQHQHPRDRHAQEAGMKEQIQGSINENLGELGFTLTNMTFTPSVEPALADALRTYAMDKLRLQNKADLVPLNERIENSEIELMRKKMSIIIDAVGGQEAMRDNASAAAAAAYIATALTGREGPTPNFTSHQQKNYVNAHIRTERIELAGQPEGSDAATQLTDGQAPMELPN